MGPRGVIFLKQEKNMCSIIPIFSLNSAVSQIPVHGPPLQLTTVLNKPFSAVIYTDCSIIINVSLVQEDHIKKSIKHTKGQIKRVLSKVLFH